MGAPQRASITCLAPNDRALVASRDGAAHVNLSWVTHGLAVVPGTFLGWLGVGRTRRDGVEHWPGRYLDLAVVFKAMHYAHSVHPLTTHGLQQRLTQTPHCTPDLLLPSKAATS